MTCPLVSSLRKQTMWPRRRRTITQRRPAEATNGSKPGSGIARKDLSHSSENCFHKYAEISTRGRRPYPYTLIFKTVKTEPGWNIGIKVHLHIIDAEAWIVESNDHRQGSCEDHHHEDHLARDAVGYDFETGARLQEAYAKAGKELGAFIKGKVK